MAKGQRATIETQFHRKFPYKTEEQPALYDFMFQVSYIPCILLLLVIDIKF